MNPAALLMDEPFGALDAQTRIVMQEELVRLARRNPRTVLFITHSVEEAVYLADRVVVMGKRPGRILETLAIRPVREAEGWEAQPIEDVMDTPAFTHLRARIWRLLKAREQEAPAA
jgi:NitT/TauT family transport system ATP-binding protein